MYLNSVTKDEPPTTLSSVWKVEVDIQPEHDQGPWKRKGIEGWAVSEGSCLNKSSVAIPEAR